MHRLILGLNFDHGDSSAALVGEEGILAAISEERLNRTKHSADFPSLAIKEVLSIGRVSIGDVTDIAVARDPFANLYAKLTVGLKAAHKLKSGFFLDRLRVHREALGVQGIIARCLGVERSGVKASLHRVEHHLAHVASAYYWSPFDECVAFSIDGAGDFATTMWAACKGNDIHVMSRSLWPHSLGVFYTALCQYIGFDRYGEEYKVMGLSAYGKNRYSNEMKTLVNFDQQNGLRLNLDYFSHHRSGKGFEMITKGEAMVPQLWSGEMEKLLGPARKRNSPITGKEEDIAASVQARYEDVFMNMVRALVRKTGQRKIVLAGGCALNSVANGRMVTEGLVDDAYFQPAASDDGTALGAALYVLHAKYKVPRKGQVSTAFWGTGWTDTAIEKALRANGRPFQKCGRTDLVGTAASAISQGKIIGWFQGREEWGPRALGNRSILCNPSLPDMKAILNARIKNREPFRPFAPTIREEDLSTVFEGTHPVPFMIVVYNVKVEWRGKLPAITHEDGTGRVQTVKREENPLYYDLITEFHRQTGVPVLLNTSFNENEPIVHTPEQAIDCFERTRMDCLGIGSFWLSKEQ